MRQVEFNKRVLGAIKEIVSILQGQGYAFSPDIDVSKGHVHIVIAKRLDTISKNINSIEEDVKNSNMSV